MKPNRLNISIAVLIILHTVGYFGIGIFGAEMVLMLTPINLLVTAGLMLFNHNHWKHSWVFAFTYLAGFAIEVIGVQTGFPFGAYAYGPVLGPKLMETPLMIGVNWFILLYGSYGIAERIGRSVITKALLSAGFMVLIDYLIEPVAIAVNMWTWDEVNPPLENYLGWFAVAFVIALVWSGMKIKVNTRMAQAVYLIEFLFFGALSLTLA